MINFFSIGEDNIFIPDQAIVRLKRSERSSLQTILLFARKFGVRQVVQHVFRT